MTGKLLNSGFALFLFSLFVLDLSWTFAPDSSCRRVRGNFYSERLGQIVLGDKKFMVNRTTGKIIARPSISGKRILRDEKYSERFLVEGAEKGSIDLKTEKEIIESLDRSRAGIGITGGGDAAGIGAFLAALRQNLPEDFIMLGVKNAGEGLAVSPDKFMEQLVLIDDLAAKDISTQSSAPFGSSRVDPFKANAANTRTNIAGWGFFYGTGGNDHLGLLERISKQFPQMVIVGTFKSIDGNGVINKRSAQMLGFHTAVDWNQKAIYNAAQSGATHKQWQVIEIFGKESGKLAFESARRKPTNLSELSPEERRKIEDVRDTVMILVPERPTSFSSIVEEANKIKRKEGGVTIVVAEGFLPPELQKEMNRLANNPDLKKAWLAGNISAENIPDLIETSGATDPRNDLKRMLRDSPGLAAKFAEMVWERKFEDYGNVTVLAGIRHFIIQALKTLVGAEKVNELVENYEARGATPTGYDLVMGRKIGRVAANLIKDGVRGGKAVVYFDTGYPKDPFNQEPAVLDLIGVSGSNDLNNRDLYSDQELRENGVFWEDSP